MRILGIETSCDETGVAIYDEHLGLLANQVYSQIVLHEEYGGVVPELAARDHVHRVIPLILSTLKEACLNPCDIHGIAYTAGPGLVGALLVGASVACALAYAWEIPLVEIHHMEAHLLSPMIKQVDSVFDFNGKVDDFIQVPFIALLVSGGHTQLVMVRKIGEYKILGESVDDAVGEVFDKIAVLLGLKYPGGALLSKMARSGVKNRYIFPKPMLSKKYGLNFSFSGLKTAVARAIMLNNNDDQNRSDIAYGFERAVVEILTIKCYRALKQTKINRLLVSGGVSANNVLKLHLSNMLFSINGELFFPKTEFCTDNGAMVSYAGLIRFKAGLFKRNLSISVRPRWSLESLPKIKGKL